MIFDLQNKNCRESRYVSPYIFLVTSIYIKIFAHKGNIISMLQRYNLSDMIMHLLYLTACLYPLRRYIFYYRLSSTPVGAVAKSLDLYSLYGKYFYLLQYVNYNSRFYNSQV